MDKTYLTLFSLLRQALGTDHVEDSLPTLDAKEWESVYQLAKEQSVRGISFETVRRLNDQQCPPEELLFMWTAEAERIKGRNKLVYEEAARLTKFFAQEGRRTAVLKGQANARLYPNPYSRQSGDIDLWVEGGRKSVSELVVKMGLTKQKNLKVETSYHHIHLPRLENGVTVEIHFRPSSGSHNPFTNRRLQKFLEAEIQKSEPCPEGFCVPTMTFALMMQMSHIQRHFLSGGIGMRQLLDYYELLTHSTQEERDDVAKRLKSMGLHWTAGAVMWVLGEVMNLKQDYMLKTPDEKRGRKMLESIIKGGNFGRYDQGYLEESLWKRWLMMKKRTWSLWSFDPWEIPWIEIRYWKIFLERMPLRIKHRKLSLKGVKLESEE